MSGGGTNFVVRSVCVCWGVGGMCPGGHHSQMAQRCSGCETGLQITVWRSDAVTFVVGGIRHSLSPRAGTAMCFLATCIMRNPKAMAGSDQTQQRSMAHSPKARTARLICSVEAATSYISVNSSLSPPILSSLSKNQDSIYLNMHKRWRTAQTD